MSKILSVARFTVLSILRFRVGIVLLIVLAIGVIGLPFILKHNGTAEAFIQVYLTYTVGFVTLLLGLTTLWLGCSLLSKDIEENQLQLITSKPIARWEIWTGKWLGLSLFNGIMMIFSGVAIYGLLIYQSSKLSEGEQLILKERVMVARNAVSEPPQDRSAEIENILQERMKKEDVAKMGEDAVRQRVMEDVFMIDQVVNPQHMRFWNIDLPTWRQEKISAEPTHIRFKFHAAEFQRGRDYSMTWVVAKRDGSELWRENFTLPANQFHEILIPPSSIPEKEPFRIECRNYNDMTLIFPQSDPLQLLYKDGSFSTNYTRALAIIFAGLVLMGALGLFASSFLSFPVATFMTLGLVLLFSSGQLIQEVLLENTLGDAEREGGPSNAVRTLDKVMIPVFKFVGGSLESISPGSPIESLTSGRSISAGLMMSTIFKQIIIVGGIIASLGMWILTNRELAIANTKS